MLDKLALTIGFQGESGGRSHPDANVNVATVALYNEFGTIESPQRSFLRSTMFERRAEIAAAFAKELRPVVMGKRKAVDGLSAVGAIVAKFVRQKIDQAGSWAVPNEIATIKKKGHSQPLRGGDILTGSSGGTMKKAVSWAVRRGGVVLATGS